MPSWHVLTWGVRGIDADAAVIDALLDGIELALDDALRFLRPRRGVALERLEPAVDAVQLDPELDRVAFARHLLLLPEPRVASVSLVLNVGM